MWTRARRVDTPPRRGVVPAAAATAVVAAAHTPDPAAVYTYMLHCDAIRSEQFENGHFS